MKTMTMTSVLLVMTMFVMMMMTNTRRSRTPAKPSFSVSGRGLKKPEVGHYQDCDHRDANCDDDADHHHQDCDDDGGVHQEGGGRNGVSSRISMNGPVHWGGRIMLMMIMIMIMMVGYEDHQLDVHDNKP